jgi:hypothetical protein
MLVGEEVLQGGWIGLEDFTRLVERLSAGQVVVQVLWLTFGLSYLMVSTFSARWSKSHQLRVGLRGVGGQLGKEKFLRGRLWIMLRNFLKGVSADLCLNSTSGRPSLTHLTPVYCSRSTPYFIFLARVITT